MTSKPAPTPLPDAAGRRLAMLIDADNAQAALLDRILAEASRYGLVTIRRAYGDWTTSQMNSWKPTLQDYAVQPIQQFRYTVGKNATDSALIIDAMDILYSRTVEGFCIVSSDSDYTRLATRIREAGIFVMGIGRRTTPRSLVNACEIFVVTENLQGDPGRPASGAGGRRAPAPDPTPLLLKALDVAVGDDEWTSLGVLGSTLRQLDPSFDTRTYGHRQLSLLLRAYPKRFDLREVKQSDGSLSISVKLKG